MAPLPTFLPSNHEMWRRSLGRFHSAQTLSGGSVQGCVSVVREQEGAGGRRRELYRVVEICPGAGALRYKSVPSQLYNQRSHDTWEHCAGATLIQTQPAETTKDRETGISVILCMKKFKFEGKIIVFFYRRHFSPLIFITLYIEASLCRAANQQAGACGRMSEE